MIGPNPQPVSHVLFFCVSLSFACTTSEPPLTQLVVAVDTDLPIGTGIDAITLELTDPSGATEVFESPLAGDGAIALPLTLGLVHRGGPLGPIQALARGTREGAQVVEQHVRTRFARDQSLVIHILLLSDCVAAECPEATTCRSAECVPDEIEPELLEKLTGPIARIDLGPERPCPLGYEDCNGDPSDGCEASLTSIDHCGACGVPCRLAGAISSCASGSCVLVSCMDGRDNCDGRPENGCEADLTSMEHCGACDHSCAADPPSAISVCDAGACALRCTAGHADCNGSTVDGCEESLSSPATCGDCETRCAALAPLCASDVSSPDVFACASACGDPRQTVCDGTCVDLSSDAERCGACDRACDDLPRSSPLCASGTCTFECDDGWADCNGLPSDGCEQSLGTSESCGGCGAACVVPQATAACSDRDCAIEVCDPGWRDCNGSATDGCETLLGTSTDCGGCRMACSGATPVCAGDLEAGFVCVSSCSDSQALCSGSCVDTSTNPQHCGACGMTCPSPDGTIAVCEAGVCATVVCLEGRGDCNRDPSDGCETELASDVHDCGACGVVCPPLEGASEACVDSRCVIAACRGAAGDCDGEASNGCEENLAMSSSNCGGCGRICPAGTQCRGGLCN